MGLISPISDIELFIPMSDYSAIGLYFDVGYRIEQSDKNFADIGLILCAIFIIIDRYHNFHKYYPA